MLLMCQAKQMWRGDNIYFHNLEQIWRAAFLFSGACSCRKPGSPAAFSRSIYSSIELSFLRDGLLSAGVGTWTLDGGGGVKAASGTSQKSEHGDTSSVHPFVFWVCVGGYLSAES